MNEPTVLPAMQDYAETTDEEVKIDMLADNYIRKEFAAIITQVMGAQIFTYDIVGRIKETATKAIKNMTRTVELDKESYWRLQGIKSLVVEGDQFKGYIDLEARRVEEKIGNTELFIKGWERVLVVLEDYHYAHDRGLPAAGAPNLITDLCKEAEHDACNFKTENAGMMFHE